MGEDAEVCPLCVEEMDIADKNFTHVLVVIVCACGAGTIQNLNGLCPLVGLPIMQIHMHFPRSTRKSKYKQNSRFFL